MLVELTEFETQLRTQILKNWKNYNLKRIDLGVARAKQQYDLAGKYICVEKLSSADAAATIILNDKDNDELDLADGVEIETLFKKVFITNAAQADEWIDIIFGADFKYKKKIEAEAGGLTFVNRGDLSVYDFDVNDFIFDSTWRELDLSSVVPEGCVLAIIHIYEGASNILPIKFRTGGNVNTVNVVVFSPAGETAEDWHTFLVSPNENGVIEYWGYAAQSFVFFNFVVVGYFLL